eukprot:PITA_28528
MDSIRLVLAIAASCKWEAHHVDMKSEFFHGYLKEEIYMDQPQGYIYKYSLVFRLKKYFYGLKQAPRAWNLTSAIDSEKSALHNRFSMTDLGLLHYFLGLEVSQSTSGINTAQSKYASDLLVHFQMTQCNPAAPFLSGIRFEDASTTTLVDNTLYR